MNDNALIASVLDLAERSRRVFAWTGGKRGFNTAALLVLVALLERPGQTPGELTARCGLPSNRTSEVLAGLRRDGYVEDRPVGRGIPGREYLTDDGVEAATEFLAHAAEALAEDKPA